ncbi:MazG nucleotide pyrophosphohydrolase domain-containing protein [Arthrobacter sp. H14]|uniref:MazG nucleotide pyrophosphohydrolase domain-containing protein n=1 Tax=Arthrobacter sp. H14 TaxID=1312959 RepID=UPI0009DDD9E8|nr:MazG nucleotide pyrophosphohydrolase domain-containing protein [Arthrobacter sp. H14]
MGELTHESLVEYLIEETYELVDAVEGGHPAEELQGELGDVLLQVVLHARLAEESGSFAMRDVVEALTAKMVRRNPHVFQPDGTLQESFPATVDEIIERWHAVKKQEKPERTSPFDGVPHHLPALVFAAKTLKRADRAGLEPTKPWAERPGQQPRTEAELGDFLLDVVGQAAANGLDAERALRAAVVRFQADCTRRA